MARIAFYAASSAKQVKLGTLPMQLAQQLLCRLLAVMQPTPCATISLVMRLGMWIHTDLFATLSADV